MKLRNAIKYAVVGSLAAAPGLAAAAPFTDFGNFTYDTSTNTVTSTLTSLACTELEDGDDFLMEECTDGTNTYFRTIVTGVSGRSGQLNFSSESLVVEGFGGPNNGLAHQAFVDGGPADQTVTINTGDHFTPTNGAEIKISQSLVEGGENFTSNFDYEEGFVQGATTNDTASYEGLTIDQDIAQSGMTNTFDLSETAYDDQTGTLTSLTDSENLSIFVDIGSTFSLDEGIAGASGTATLVDGTTIAYSVGDDLDAIEISQTAGPDFTLGEFANLTTAESGDADVFGSALDAITYTADPF